MNRLRPAGFGASSPPLSCDTTPERRSVRPRLTPALEARLRGLQGVVDMLGDQIDIVLRDGTGALGPVHELLAQAAVQGRELFAEVRTDNECGAHDPSAAAARRHLPGFAREEA